MFKAMQNDENAWQMRDGSSLMGYVNAPYDKIVALLGKPTSGDGYKVDAEWVIQGRDGTVATVYNWKNGPNYLEDDSRVQEIREWHIGGKDSKAVSLVAMALKEPTRSAYQ